ncbi:RNA polymerase sigma factor [Bacteroides sp. K03]|uniref:Sigma-70 family RNA polymerase sigma factor n=1 Tax=Bacteroides nordii CL02T12C05 TaxID=997884 RepID=I9GII1_9BACE|nr:MULTISPECIES: RNA polymerase sigma factor [Bacteroides]EIY46519.1 sigma-70 family RNA polymerase sigma factor [Bacteroides nordii CL02T12C05]MBX9189051.1 RNA polymerase sigma factor [Bacteroides sp. K03]MCG4769704.1 RNA polymerase sigma factor [Bacteroides nordii]
MDKLTSKIVGMESELRHFALKLTADQDSANDLVQDCMLKALDNKEKFVHAQNFKGWMYTIMRNLFINNYRRVTREMSMMDDSYSIGRQNLLEVEDGERFEYAYDLKELHKVINAVPESMRKPFLMYVAGFKYNEIAEKMGLPIGTIKSRLFFVRKRLQRELKEFGK